MIFETQSQEDNYGIEQIEHNGNENWDETQEFIIETSQEIQARETKQQQKKTWKEQYNMNNLEKPAMEAHAKKRKIWNNREPKFYRVEKKKENEKEKSLPGIEPGPLPSRNGAPLPIGHRGF